MGVAAIINLQEPGEHPFCGDGIVAKTGFSYTPENLMNNQISFFNNSLQVFAVEHLGKEDELFVYHYDSLCKLIEKKSLLKCKRRRSCV